MAVGSGRLNAQLGGLTIRENSEPNENNTTSRAFNRDAFPINAPLLLTTNQPRDTPPPYSPASMSHQPIEIPTYTPVAEISDQLNLANFEDGARIDHCLCVYESSYGINFSTLTKILKRFSYSPGVTADPLASMAEQLKNEGETDEKNDRFVKPAQEHNKDLRLYEIYQYLAKNNPNDWDILGKHIVDFTMSSMESQYSTPKAAAKGFLNLLIQCLKQQKRIDMLNEIQPWVDEQQKKLDSSQQGQVNYSCLAKKYSALFPNMILYRKLQEYQERYHFDFISLVNTMGDTDPGHFSWPDPRRTILQLTGKNKSFLDDKRVYLKDKNALCVILTLEWLQNKHFISKKMNQIKKTESKKPEQSLLDEFKEHFTKHYDEFEKHFPKYYQTNTIGSRNHERFFDLFR